MKRKQQEQHFIQNYEQRGSQPAEPGALMPASESSFPPLESLLSKARLHEQHLFRAQHHARTRAKMMTITNKSTPPPPCTCSTVKTKIPAAELLSCPVDSPVAVVTVGESTATSRGPHMLPMATFTLKHFDSLFSSKTSESETSKDRLHLSELVPQVRHLRSKRDHLLLPLSAQACCQLP